MDAINTLFIRRKFTVWWWFILSFGFLMLWISDCHCDSFPEVEKPKHPHTSSTAEASPFNFPKNVQKSLLGGEAQDEDTPPSKRKEKETEVQKKRRRKVEKSKKELKSKFERHKSTKTVQNKGLFGTGVLGVVPADDFESDAYEKIRKKHRHDEEDDEDEDVTTRRPKKKKKKHGSEDNTTTTTTAEHHHKHKNKKGKVAEINEKVNMEVNEKVKDETITTKTEKVEEIKEKTVITETKSEKVEEIKEKVITETKTSEKTLNDSNPTVPPLGPTSPAPVKKSMSPSGTESSVKLITTPRTLITVQDRVSESSVKLITTPRALIPVSEKVSVSMSPVSPMPGPAPTSLPIIFTSTDPKSSPIASITTKIPKRKRKLHLKNSTSTANEHSHSKKKSQSKSKKEKKSQSKKKQSGRGFGKRLEENTKDEDNTRNPSTSADESQPETGDGDSERTASEPNLPSGDVSLDASSKKYRRRNHRRRLSWREEIEDGTDTSSASVESNIQQQRQRTESRGLIAVPQTIFNNIRSKISNGNRKSFTDDATDTRWKWKNGDSNDGSISRRRDGTGGDETISDSTDTRWKWKNGDSNGGSISRRRSGTGDDETIPDSTSSEEH